MTHLYFETHATSLDNEAGRASGWHDVDLSPAGEAQARALGARYEGVGLDAVHCSDLWRAWRTAELAFGDRVPVVRDIRLRECDYGDLTRASVADVDRLRLTHLSTPFPGGESYEQVVARTRAFLDDVVPSHGGRPLLVIGHRATFFALEHLLRGRPLAEVVADPFQWQAGWQYTR
jgi:2,3-bisphosphoglycerate-dependent phosphoglycerate mutase